MRRTTACLLAASLIALPGCDLLPGGEDSGGHPDGPAAAKSTPASAGVVKKVGKLRLAKDDLGNRVLIKVSTVTTYKAGQGPLGKAPQSGSWALLRVTMKGVRGKWPANALYFTLKPPHHKLVAGDDGNGPKTPTPPPQLDPERKLRHGQTATGNILLDTPAPPGSRIYFRDPLDKPLVSWRT